MPADSSPGAIAVVRAPRPDEAAAVAELVNRVTAGWLGWPPTSEQGVLARWRARHVDPERDFLVAVTAEGAVRGYAAVFRTRVDRIWTELRTAEDEDVASRLLHDVERRARELAGRVTSGGRIVLRSQVEQNQLAVASVLRRRRYVPVREALRVVIELGSPLPAPEWPAGVAVRGFDPARDARDAHALAMTALADTWEFEPQSFADWYEDWIDAPGFDSSLWTVAEHAGGIVGMAQCRYEPPGSDLGWFELVAVEREWRRRGLGRALVLHALASLRDRGTTQVGLGVDPENPTGAFRVAAAAGGKVAQRFTTFELELARRRRLPALAREVLSRLAARGGRR